MIRTRAEALEAGMPDPNEFPYVLRNETGADHICSCCGEIGHTSYSFFPRSLLDELKTKFPEVHFELVPLEVHGDVCELYQEITFELGN